MKKNIYRGQSRKVLSVALVLFLTTLCFGHKTLSQHLNLRKLKLNSIYYADILSEFPGAMTPDNITHDCDNTEALRYYGMKIILSLSRSLRSKEKYEISLTRLRLDADSGIVILLDNLGHVALAHKSSNGLKISTAVYEMSAPAFIRMANWMYKVVVDYRMKKVNVK